MALEIFNIKNRLPIGRTDGFSAILKCQIVRQWVLRVGFSPVLFSSPAPKVLACMLQRKLYDLRPFQSQGDVKNSVPVSSLCGRLNGRNLWMSNRLLWILLTVLSRLSKSQKKTKLRYLWHKELIRKFNLQIQVFVLSEVKNPENEKRFHCYFATKILQALLVTISSQSQVICDVKANGNF